MTHGSPEMTSVKIGAINPPVLPKILHSPNISPLMSDSNYSLVKINNTVNPVELDYIIKKIANYLTSVIFTNSNRIAAIISNIKQPATVLLFPT